MPTRKKYLACVILLLCPALLVGYGNKRPRRRLKKESNVFEREGQVGNGERDKLKTGGKASKQETITAPIMTPVSSENAAPDVKPLASQKVSENAALTIKQAKQPSEAPTLRPSSKPALKPSPSPGVPIVNNGQIPTASTTARPSQHSVRSSLLLDPSVAALVSSWMATGTPADVSSTATDSPSRQPVRASLLLDPTVAALVSSWNAIATPYDLSSSATGSPSRQTVNSSLRLDPTVAALVDSWTMQGAGVSKTKSPKLMKKSSPSNSSPDAPTSTPATVDSGYASKEPKSKGASNAKEPKGKGASNATSRPTLSPAPSCETSPMSSKKRPPGKGSSKQNKLPTTHPSQAPQLITLPPTVPTTSPARNTPGPNSMPATPSPFTSPVSAPIPTAPTIPAPNSFPTTTSPITSPVTAPIPTPAPTLAPIIPTVPVAPTPTGGTILPASPFGVTYSPTLASVTQEDFTPAGDLTCAHIEQYVTKVLNLSPFIVLEDVTCTATATTTSPTTIFFDTAAVFGADSLFVPNQENIDQLLSVALLPPEVELLITELNALPSSNPFSSTTSVLYELSPPLRQDTDAGLTRPSGSIAAPSVSPIVAVTPTTATTTDMIEQPASKAGNKATSSQNKQVTPISAPVFSSERGKQAKSSIAGSPGKKKSVKQKESTAAPTATPAWEQSPSTPTRPFTTSPSSFVSKEPPTMPPFTTSQKTETPQAQPSSTNEKSKSSKSGSMDKKGGKGGGKKEVNPTCPPILSPTTLSPVNSASIAPMAPAPNSAPVTKAPTKAPVMEPSISPVTSEPIVPSAPAPSTAPLTKAPTQAPAKAPTISPVTFAPIVPATQAPVVAPTLSPVTSAPIAPTAPAPSTAPLTKAPTQAPVMVTTVSPTTSAPILPATQAPVMTPTISPVTSAPILPATQAPVMTPTISPVTSAPIAPTAPSPSATPLTEAPTQAPVMITTVSPTTSAPIFPTTPAPSSAPVTNAPTKAPVKATTISPVTAAPIVPTAPAPSTAPVTKAPTQDPVKAPTISPVTSAPITPTTLTPSTAPVTKAPTRAPANVPTASPVIPIVPTAVPAPVAAPTPGTIVKASPFSVTYTPTPGFVTQEDFTPASELSCAHIEQYMKDIFAMSPFILLQDVNCTALATTTAPTTIFYEVTTSFADGSVIPSTMNIDDLIGIALLPPTVAALITELNTLPASNPFSSTTDIAYKVTAPPIRSAQGGGGTVQTAPASSSAPVTNAPTIAPVKATTTSPISAAPIVPTAPDPITAPLAKAPTQAPVKTPTRSPVTFVPIAPTAPTPSTAPVTKAPTRAPANVPTDSPVIVPKAVPAPVAAPTPGTVIKASPFNVTYTPTSGAVTQQDFTPASDLSCAHIEQYIKSIFDLAAPFVLLQDVNCTAVATATAPTTIFYEVSTNFADASNVIPSAMNIDDIISTAMLTPTVNALITELNALPSSNPFSPTTTIVHQVTASAAQGEGEIAGVVTGSVVFPSAVALLSLFSLVAAAVAGMRRKLTAKKRRHPAQLKMPGHGGAPLWNHPIDHTIPVRLSYKKVAAIERTSGFDESMVINLCSYGDDDSDNCYPDPLLRSSLENNETMLVD